MLVKMFWAHILGKDSGLVSGQNVFFPLLSFEHSMSKRQDWIIIKDDPYEMADIFLRGTNWAGMTEIYMILLNF